MACIRKYGRVWQAQVRRKGVRSVTKSFRTKSAAAAWAKTIESEIERGWLTDVSVAQNTTVAALLARYETEILPTKRAQASERSRIKRLSRALGAFNLVQLSPTALARYRNERLKSASTQTVRHELSLLRRIINVARSEWGVFLPRGNPAAATVLPKPSPGRTRRLEGDEEARLLHAVVGNAVMAAIIGFALETALRRREIAYLTWTCVNLASRTAHISTTKTGIPRTVPLSSKAAEVLQKCDRRLRGALWPTGRGKGAQRRRRPLKSCLSHPKALARGGAHCSTRSMWLST
jgi:integrase